MAGYTPLFDSLTTGTLCGKWPDIGLWPIILSMKDARGMVRASPEFISAVTGLALSQVIACIERFCQPDPASTSKDHDGRRLIPDPDERNVWHVVNHTKYQEKARKAARQAEETASGRDAERKRRERGVQSCPAVSGGVPLSDTDTDTDKNKSPSDSVELKLDSGPVQRIFEHWKAVWKHPRAKLDPKRRRLIAVALKGYSEADLRGCIEGYLNSSHHCGENERQTIYDDIGLFLRDAAHIDAGLNFRQGHRAPAKIDLIFRREEEYMAYKAAVEKGLSFSTQTEWDSHYGHQTH